VRDEKKEHVHSSLLKRKKKFSLLSKEEEEELQCMDLRSGLVGLGRILLGLDLRVRRK
jgi:hypothetical protein